MGILNTLTIYRLSDADSKRIKCSMPDCDKQAVYGENKGTAPYWYHCDDHVTKPVMTHSHTPGPWTLCLQLSHGEIVGHSVSRVKVVDVDMRTAERKANAHLIAAAPEMLEVLRRLIAYNDGLLQRSQFPPIELEPARAAIAKAEGHRE